MEVLKLCPFCGGKAATKRDAGNEVINQRWWTGCPNCKVGFTSIGSNSWSPDIKQDRFAELSTIDRWNERV